MTKKVVITSQLLQIPKVITQTGKLLQAISLKLVTFFAVKLFRTTVKLKILK